MNLIAPASPIATTSAGSGKLEVASVRHAAGTTLSASEQQRLVAAFLRDGVVRLPGLLAPQAATLRATMDRIFACVPPESDPGLWDIVRFRAFEHDQSLRDLLVLEPVISLMEAILGDNCHMISQNLLRTPPGRALDSWHVDDALFFPLEEPWQRHPVTPPVLVVCAFVLLSDAPSLEYGPTQVVPGSCWSGRHPPAGIDAPSWQGREPLSLTGAAGDCYLQHTQCWHRGAPNRSDTTRYLLGTMYARRWMSQRLAPFVNYQLPPSVEAHADDRLLRVLGHHPLGTEGYA